MEEVDISVEEKKETSEEEQDTTATKSMDEQV